MLILAVNVLLLNLAVPLYLRVFSILFSEINCVLVTEIRSPCSSRLMCQFLSAFREDLGKISTALEQQADIVLFPSHALRNTESMRKAIRTWSAKTKWL